MSLVHILCRCRDVSGAYLGRCGDVTHAYLCRCNDVICAYLCRCNDVLELVQTTSHFRLLAQAAEVGGAGCQSLDSLVREIHLKFSQAMEEFFSHVKNVLAMDNSQVFEKAFFSFRMVVKVSVGAPFGCCQYLIVLWQLSTVVHLQSADVL